MDIGTRTRPAGRHADERSTAPIRSVASRSLEGRSAVSAASPTERAVSTACPAASRDRLMLDLVRAEIAVVPGYASADLVDSEGDVLEIGMTSVSAVEPRALR